MNSSTSVRLGSNRIRSAKDLIAENSRTLTDRVRLIPSRTEIRPFILVSWIQKFEVRFKLDFEILIYISISKSEISCIRNASKSRAKIFKINNLYRVCSFYRGKKTLCVDRLICALCTRKCGESIERGYRTDGIRIESTVSLELVWNERKSGGIKITIEYRDARSEGSFLLDVEEPIYGRNWWFRCSLC